MNARLMLAGAAIGVALLAAACSNGDDENTPTAAATTAAPAVTQTAAASTATGAAPATTATTSAATSTATLAATAASTGQKVSANNATIAELTAAFEAAGISSASRWAREVDEYRPYAESDTNLNKLRQELAKYNPGPGVVDAIVATLQLP
ncbi:MAG: hypothetical protein AB7L91_07460 [Dehalococcoidia bacterium]